VTAGFTPSHICIVHAGEIVVNERVRMNQLEASAHFQNVLRRDRIHLRRCPYKERAKAFAASQNTIAHGFMQTRVGGREMSV
jgi:hypothetical protein